MRASYYDMAQICRDGHIINMNANRYPEHNQKSCNRCGATTITDCQYCGTKIRGEYYVDGVINLGPREFTAPLYCHECGKPYPWTDATLKAAQELVDMATDLTDGERSNLKEDIGDQ